MWSSVKEKIQSDLTALCLNRGDFPLRDRSVLFKHIPDHTFLTAEGNKNDDSLKKTFRFSVKICLYIENYCQKVKDVEG